MSTLTAAPEPFVSIPEWVLMHPALSGNAVRLYGVLKRYARMSEQAWPGRDRLAGHLRCSVDTIDRLMRELRDAGAVDVIPRWLAPVEDHAPDKPVPTTTEPGPGRARTSNLYRLRWDPPGPGSAPAADPSRTDAAGTYIQEEVQEAPERLRPSSAAGGVQKTGASPPRTAPTDVGTDLLSGYLAAVRPSPPREERRRLGAVIDRLLAGGLADDGIEDPPVDPVALRRALAQLAGDVAAGRVKSPVGALPHIAGRMAREAVTGPVYRDDGTEIGIEGWG